MEHWLDDVARTVASGISRRAALRRIGGGLVAVVLGSAVPGQALAKRGKGNGGDNFTRCGRDVCGPNEKCCNNACRNIKNDEQNCGDCGVTCPTGSHCADGHCTTCEHGQVCGGRCCADGETCCGDNCVNLGASEQNCGACGNTCPAGQPSCCNGNCVNKQANERNCGACNNVCPVGQACINGNCNDRCPAERVCGSSCCRADERCVNGNCRQTCGGQLCEPDAVCCTVNGNPACIDANHDRNNCGACGNVCPAGTDCQGGRCTCPSGRATCGPNKICCADNQACRGGACLPRCGDDVCDPDNQACCTVSGAPTCVNVKKDPRNCGTCGNVCPAGTFCVNGQCGTNCDPPQQCGQRCCNDNRVCLGGLCLKRCGDRLCQPDQDCCTENGAPVCRNTSTNSDNCGACGNVCPRGSRCVNGACTSCGNDDRICGDRCCARGEDCCGNRCVNLNSDEQNCRVCGNACPSGQTCCNGSCVDKQTDPVNCGVCARVCPVGTTCSGGHCRGTCPPGTACTNECCANGESCAQSVCTSGT